MRVWGRRLTEHQDDRALLEGYRAIQIIFFAIIGSLVMYSVVGLVLVPSLAETKPDFPLEPLLFALTAMSAFLTIGAWYLRKVLLGRDLPENPSAEKNVEVSGVEYAVQTYRKTIVIMAAMAESIGIFGLVLLLLGARQGVFFTFLGLSLLVMLMLGPKFSELKALADRYSS